jgi:glycopeptide antibiotics resistance protein
MHLYLSIRQFVSGVGSYSEKLHDESFLLTFSFIHYLVCLVTGS